MNFVAPGAQFFLTNCQHSRRAIAQSAGDRQTRLMISVAVGG
jgi:hypothetical protein